MQLSNTIASLREASEEDDRKTVSLQSQVSAANARAELPAGGSGAGSSGGDPKTLVHVETQVGNANDWVTKEQLQALSKAYSSGQVVLKAKVDRDRQTMAVAVCTQFTDIKTKRWHSV